MNQCEEAIAISLLRQTLRFDSHEREHLITYVNDFQCFSTIIIY